MQCFHPLKPMTTSQLFPGFELLFFANFQPTITFEHYLCPQRTQAVLNRNYPAALTSFL